MPKYKTIENRIERKTYIQGKFIGKFIGYLDPRKSDIIHENFYDLEVISGEISTIKNKINLRHWEIGESKEFQNTNNFLTKIPDNLPLKVIDGSNTIGTYIINLNDKKLNNYKLTNQVYEGTKVFGDITGEISGYLRHFDIEHIKIEITDKTTEKTFEKSNSFLQSSRYKTNKLTGETEVYQDYKRWEYYYSDNSTYWGAWIKQSPVKNSGLSVRKTLSSIFQLVVTSIFIIPLIFFGWKLILPLVVLLGIVYLLSLLNTIIIRISKYFFRFLGIVFLLLMIYGIIYSVVNSLKSPYIRKVSVIDDLKEVSSIEGNSITEDSIISHHRIWVDYSNNKYEVDLKTRISDFKNASQLRNELSIPMDNTFQYNRIVSTIHEYDKNKLNLVYAALDSLKTSKKLNKIEFAEVIVSLIQDIPYSLILSNSCNETIYNDNFIKEYLSNKKACKGYTKYGLLTPVEFVSTLKGDCDTRTLLLFTIFNHYNYDVVMLSSELYKHSIIGINLPYKGISKLINGKKYIVWETTSPGIPPGIISNEISDMKFWNVSLISNKKISI